jgi:hypothetical protein
MPFLGEVCYSLAEPQEKKKKEVPHEQQVHTIKGRCASSIVVNVSSQVASYSQD